MKEMDECTARWICTGKLWIWKSLGQGKRIWRRNRARIRANPEKHSAYKQKEKEHYRKREQAGEIKTIHELPPLEQQCSMCVCLCELFGYAMCARAASTFIFTFGFTTRSVRADKNNTISFGFWQQVHLVSHTMVEIEIFLKNLTLGMCFIRTLLRWGCEPFPAKTNISQF